MLNVSLPPKIMVQFSDIFWRPGLGELVGKVDDSLINTWSNYSVYELFVKPDTTLQETNISHQMGSWKVIDSKYALGWGWLFVAGRVNNVLHSRDLPPKKTNHWDVVTWAMD